MGAYALDVARRVTVLRVFGGPHSAPLIAFLKAGRFVKEVGRRQIRDS